MTALAPAADFPILARAIEGRRLIYLDSAATSLKPRAVIDAVARFYEHGTANIHRGQHTLSQEASEAFESARDEIARFINATARDIVFCAGTTDAMNMIADGLGLTAGDNVVASVIDHHSNLLPWMRRCELRLLPEAADGRVDPAKLEDLIDAKTRLVSLSHVSNVTGAIQPIAEAIAIARRRNVPVAIDGAQSVPHLPIDVVELGCDFLAFSGHKMLGPSGVGVLYIAESVRDRVSPLRLGGGTVDHVRADGFTLKRAPYAFEAGTPNIEGVLGLAAAVRYLERLGMEKVASHAHALSRRMLERFAALPGAELIGPTDAARKLPIASLVPAHAAIDPNQLGMLLSDSYKIMVRAGTHCAHPFFSERGVPGSLRISAQVYTSDEDLDAAEAALRELLARFVTR